MNTRQKNAWAFPGGAMPPLRSSPLTPVACILEMDETAEESLQLLPQHVAAVPSARANEGHDQGDGHSPASTHLSPIPVRARSETAGASHRTTSLVPVPVARIASPSLERIIDGLLVRARIGVYLADNSPVDFIPTGGYQCRCSEVIDCVSKAKNIDRSEAQLALAVWFSEESERLEVQLKPHHNPFVIHKYWKYFLKKFSECANVDKSNVLLYVRRSVFLSLHRERQLKNQHLLHLLFEEAKTRFLTRKYLFSVDDVITLGSLLIYRTHGRYVAGLELPSLVDLKQFFPPGFLTTRRLGANRAPVALVDRIASSYGELSASSLDEVRTRFLLLCRECPLYGAAFFTGVVDEPPKGHVRAFLFGRVGIDVMVAVNERGIFLLPSPSDMDSYPEILLALPYNRFQFAAYQPDDLEVFSGNEMARLMITLQVPYSNRSITQWTAEDRHLFIFSKQAALIDACLRTFVQKRKIAVLRRRESLINGDEVDSEFGSGGLRQDVEASNGNFRPTSIPTKRKFPRPLASNHFPNVINHFDKFVFHPVDSMNPDLA